MAKILIVDDHESNRELMVVLCQHLGHKTLEAADGAEALTLVRIERPQLVVCDILMPTMDGYEFVRQLRADPNIAQTEVIFYTANYREREARSLASAVGVSHIIFKPSEAIDIMQVLEAALTHTPELESLPDTSEFDREHLRLITDKLAEKAHEQEQLNQRLSTLIDLNLKLASERDPHVLLEEVCRGARELLGARYAFLCVTGKNTDHANYLFSSGLSPDQAAKLQCPVIDHGMFGELMAERKTVRFQNPKGKPKNVDLPAAFPEIHHGLVAPIASLGSVYGWLCLTDKVGAQEFGDEDERILTIHAAQVGRIYENGSLYAQLLVRNNQLQAEMLERIRTERYLKSSEEELAGLVSTAMDAIITVDEQQRILLFNPAAEQMFGYSAAEIRAQSLDVLIPELSRAKHSDHIREFGRAGSAAHRMSELRTVFGRRKDGGEFPVEISISLLSTGDKNIYTAILRDISLRKEAERKINSLNRVYAVLSQINSLIVRTHDRDELFQEATRIATEAGKFSKAWIGLADWDAMQLHLVARSGNSTDYFEKLQITLNASPDNIRTRFLLPLEAKQPIIINDLQNEAWPMRDEAIASGSGSLVWLPLLVNGQVAGVLSLHAGIQDFFDTEEMKLLLELAGDIGFAINTIDNSEKLHYVAYYDVLTGLANSTLFLERLAHHLNINKDPQRVVLALLDVERFKTVNDALGRQVGDGLLKQVAERLAHCAGNPDYVARLSSDHFAVIFPDITAEREVAHIIEELSESCFAHAFQVDGVELQAAAKVGIALFPDDGKDTDTLFKNAEAALKKAKTGGESYLFYSTVMNDRVAEKLSLENKLRRAVQHEEFVLYYQPKIETKTGQMVGVEALIRWQSPDMGLVSPVEFIPILEETGLILDVGAWALHQAARDHDRWLKQGLTAPRVAVNVSAIQLRQNDFVETLTEAIKGGVSPTGIDIEITESLIMEDIEGNIGKLNAIRDMGLNIYIDDFGTGYSSLSYLTRLPVQTIKIDRSFIITMLDDPNTMTLVSTIITLSHSLGMKVIAEGVDQEDQLKILRLIRCDEIQGFLYSEAVPFEAISTLLHQDTKLPERPKSA